MIPFELLNIGRINLDASYHWFSGRWKFFNDAIIENMLSWHHSGFHVYIGDRIYPSDKIGLGSLARYIVRACFSQEWMRYVPDKDSELVCLDSEWEKIKGRNQINDPALMMSFY